MNKKISIILPTFNEKENVILLIQDIHKHLQGFDYEIIVVDDSSIDGTYQSVVDKKDYKVRAVLRKENPGLAYSILAGINESTGDVLVIMDSDGNHQPQYIPFMIESLSQYVCVSASRFLQGGGMENVFRHILSKAFNVFVRIMIKSQLTDNLYGFFAIRRVALYKCSFEEIFWGYGDYFMRLTTQLHKNNMPILEFPAQNGKRRFGRTGRFFLSVFFKYTLAVFRLSFSKRKSHY